MTCVSGLQNIQLSIQSIYEMKNGNNSASFKEHFLKWSRNNLNYFLDSLAANNLNPKRKHNISKLEISHILKKENKMTKLKAPKITQKWKACFEVTNLTEDEIKDAIRGLHGIVNVKSSGPTQWLVYVIDNMDINKLSRSIIKDIKRIRKENNESL